MSICTGKARGELEALAHAVVAARITRWEELGHSRVAIELPGHRRHEDTLDPPAGCLPLPGWRRWARVTRFQPYI